MPANANGSKWIWPTTRARIYARDDMSCVWCLRTVRPKKAADGVRMATLDHVLPRSKGGSNKASNLVTACLECNTLRGDEDSAVVFAERLAGADMAVFCATLDRVIEAMGKDVPRL